MIRSLMRLVFAVTLALVLSAFSVGSSAEPVVFSKLSLVAGCKIHKIDGTLLREFAGSMCLFMSDGRYISADAERIAMYAPDKSLVWKIPGHYHHQLNWSYDGKSILALSSDFDRVEGKSLRADVLRRIDLNGKVTGEISSRKIFKKLGIAREQTAFDWEQALKEKAEFEISHFNSFHEIPPQDRKSPNPNIVAGNFIASSTLSGSVLVDKDLKIPLETITYPSSRAQAIHDVQMMSDGRILFLNNDRVRDAKNLGPHSAVEQFDPVAGKSTVTFEASPAEMFYTPVCGGVQPFGNGLIFISHVSNAFFFVASKTKKILRSDVLKNEAGDVTLTPTQQIKALDLTAFLKKW